ncbi:MAG TPA: ATP-binding protein [bacterium]|nr:ATP-binding protein [bacterium]HPQ65734.1 ATP-binding protein [bacterium]
MRISYRLSLYISFFIVVLAPLLLAFLIFEAMLRRTAEDKFFSQAERVGLGIREEISRRSGNLLKLAERYAQDESIIVFLSQGDRSRLESRLFELFGYSNLDLLEIGDSSGIVLARGHRPGDFGEDKASQIIIGNALKGMPAADIEYGVSGIALRSVAPIRSNEKAIIGTLMTGVLLNKDFFSAYKNITGFNVALFQGDVLVTSTLGSSLTWTPPAATDQSPDKVVFMSGEKEMWGIYLPVYHSTGEEFGGLLLWQDAKTILASLDIYQATLTYTFIFAVILSLGLAVFLSRNFSSPLKKLLPVMDRVSRGDLNTNMPTLRWAEFRVLGAHFQDMLTELQKSRQRVERTQRQLIVAGKLAVLGQVTAELAHEIRNPLNSMEITLSLLRTKILNKIGDDPTIEENIEALRTETKRLKRTVKDFVEAGGEITLRKKPVNVANELEKIFKLVRPQVELLGIELDFRAQDSKPILIDQNRLHQAVLNITLNACQSMKPGGKLTVRGADNATAYTISIRDTGAGMTPEERDKVLSFPFTTKTDGLGCGLTYVLRVMQAHSGEFDLESSPGVGTTVRLSFFRRPSGDGND